MARPLALITGPTAGIGHEFALQLAHRGYDFVLVARDAARLNDVAEELRDLGASCEVIVCDLSDRAALGPVEQRLKEGVDLLINNAGYGLKHPFLTNSIDDEIAMLDVLVTSVVRLTHAALGQMVERGSGGVINVSSVAGYLPRGTYSAAKAYVTRFSEWADLTYRNQGVRTMALLPGFTRTEFHQRMEVGQDSAPRWLWLDVSDLVTAALKDFDQGVTVSIPSLRYKALAAISQYTPAGLTARLQSLGRK